MIFSFDRVHEGTRHRVKDRDKAEIFQAICSAETITRKEISGTVGARPTTVSNAVHELMEDRLVVEGSPKEPGKQGRPEILLHPRFDRLVAIGIYVVSREMKGALIGLDGVARAVASAPLPSDADNTLVVDTMVGVVSQLCAMKPASSELLGVGLSLIGTINTAERKWRSTARWRKISNIDFDVIERRIGLPVVPTRLISSRLEYLLIENPSLRVGGTLLFHWGYGIGAAYARDGQVIQAAAGSFGEVGHWRVVHDAPKPCLCGGSGCLETVAALWALSPELEKLHGRIPEDEVEFAAFYQKHHMERHELIASARRHVAASVANLFMALCPDHVLVYGPFTESREAYRRAAEEILAYVPPFVQDQVSLAHLPLEFEGNMIGSTHHLFRSRLRALLTVREPGEQKEPAHSSEEGRVIDFPPSSY